MKKKCFIKKITSIILSASMMVTLVPSYNASKTFAADTFDEEGRYVSDLPIEKVEGLSEDFCMGADVSSAQALIDAGVRYVNIDGQEQDLYELMADAGLNYVRLRLWNDPYLSTETSKTVGNSYGGGVCDINYVKKMALAAQSAGLNVLLDFHYSDFWADPGKQKKPKAWNSLSNDQVVQKVYDFTYESLNTLKNAGVKNITMVQVGNETTSQICGFDIHGEYGYKAFAKGCEAIRKYNSENGTNIKSVIHYTNESNFNFKNEAQGLVNKGVDFDIFASSFYPEYSSHGDIDGICENLEGAGTVVNKKTNKNIEVMIAEVGYRYTGNSADANGVYAKYDRTEEGMAIFMRDLIAKVNEIGGIGVFYWEPAWVDVGLDYNKTGTGWASDNAKEYDSGAANGGGKCATTDLAMFKAAGGLKIKAMEALNVYKYVYKGTTSAKDTKNFAPVILEIEKGSDFNNDSMPEKVEIELKSLKMIEKSVEWNQDEIASVDTNNISDYTIEGTVEGYGTVYATVEVVDKSIVSVDDVNVAIGFGDEIKLPKTVNAVINGGKTIKANVTWDATILSKINTCVEGDYVVTGKVDGFVGDVYAYVTIAPGVVSNELVENGSFESPNIDKSRSIDNWVTTSSVGNNDNKPIYSEWRTTASKDSNHKLSIWTDGFNDYDVDCYQEIDISNHGNGMYLVSCYEYGNVNNVNLYVKDGDNTSEIKNSVKLDPCSSYQKFEFYVNITNSSKLTVGVNATGVLKNEWSNIDLVSVKYCGNGQNLSGKDLLEYNTELALDDINNNAVTQNNNSLYNAIIEAQSVINNENSTITDINNAIALFDNACNESSFKVDVTENVGGNVDVNKTSAKPGETVKLDISTDKKYSIAKVNVFDLNNKAVEVSNNEFVMPKKSVKINVEFVMKEENYLSAVFRTYYSGEGKIAVTFADDIDGLEKDLTINGKSAYYMNDDLSYGVNWYKLRMNGTYGKFDIYEVIDDETNLLYSTTDNDFRNITLNNTPYYYDGSLFANTTELMKDVKKIKFTFYVYGIGRNELSLMFANTVKNAGNPFTISGWTGKRFYNMKDASDELGEGWFKLELSTIDGTFQLYDTSSGHAENTIKWIKNFGLDGGGDAYEEVLNGYAYFVISDGKLYRDPLDTGKYIIGALDKPVVTFATSQKENTFIINWTDVENASEYEVTVGGNTIADLRADKNTYEFTAQYTGSNRINVIAKAKGYTSGKSVSTVAYVPDEVVNVSATRSSDTKANVKWNITSGGECDGFIVYKKKGTGGFTKVASVASTAKNLDVLIDKSDDYSFKVVPFADNTFGYVYGKSKSCRLTSANVAVKNGPNAGTKLKDKVFTYKVTKVAKSGVAGEVAVTGIINKKAKKAVIANEVTIGGFKYKVTSISNNAFKKLKKLSKVTIGSNVKVIGNKAFNSCKKLKAVIIKSANISKFGKASFKGIKKKATFKVPKSKKKSYKKMIKKAGAKKFKIK